MHSATKKIVFLLVFPLDSRIFGFYFFNIEYRRTFLYGLRILKLA